MQKKEIKINNIVFLTPAKINVDIDNENKDIIVGVDLINKKVYEENGETKLSEFFFNYLEEKNSIPDDFYAASDDSMQKVWEAQRENDELMKQVQLGEYSGE